MKRVASLYLPEWSIDLLRQREPRHAPPPEAQPLDLLPLKRAGDAERGGKACDAPRNTGWRPGARWARDDTPADAACWAGETREDVARRVARLPAHQRPPMREMGRRSEAADHPYKRLPGDEGGAVVAGWMGEHARGPAAPAAATPQSAITGASPHTSPAMFPRTREPGVIAGQPPTATSNSGLLPSQEHGANQAAPPFAVHANTVFPRTREPRAVAEQRPTATENPGLLPQQQHGSCAGASPPRAHATRPKQHDLMAKQPPIETGQPGLLPAQEHGACGVASFPSQPSNLRAPHLRIVPAQQIAAPAHRASPAHRTRAYPAQRLPAVTTALPSTQPRTGGETVRPSYAAPIRAWSVARPTVMPAIRYPGDGPHPDKLAAKERRPGSNDAGAQVKQVAAFFDTGRSTSGVVARVCPDRAAPSAPPAAQGTPLVTVHKVGARIEVAAACPAARALGAEPGMALTQVRAAVPDIAVRDADPDGDAAALHRLAVTLARRWTPVVARSDADGLFLDLSGVAHLHGGEERMARRLVRLLARRGVTARIGIADTPGAAWALARHAATRVAILPPGDPLPALAGFPVAALRIEDAALELLRRLGIDTVGDLAALPRAPLARRFGRVVPLRLDQASGRTAEPLDSVVPPEPIAVEQRFTEPLLTAEPIAHWLAQLVARLCAELARSGRGARAVALAATRVDAAVQVVRIGLARPTRAPEHLLRLLARRIETLDPGFGIEMLALHVIRADPLTAEAIGGDLTQAATDLAPLVDAIANRIGTTRLWRLSPRESDVPERAVAQAAPLDPPANAAAAFKRDDVRRLDRRAPAHPWHPRWPRPVRLLRRPEPVDHVMAELPDLPPARFTWRGVTHRVVRGDGPERITGEWWRRANEAQAIRDYFTVEDETGERFWLFRRGDGQRAETGDLSWYVHGTFA